MNSNLLICEAESNLAPIQVGSGTEVGGIISENTTWSDEYYIATAHILVPKGVTLKIKPGVKVSLEDHFLQVDGTLQARGNKTDRIIITGEAISTWEGILRFMSGSTPWDEETSLGCILEYCELHAKGGMIVRFNQGSSPKMVNCLVSGSDLSGMGTFGGFITNNTFCYNLVGLEATGTSIISDNFFFENHSGIGVGGTPTISNNVIRDNDQGIDVSGGSPIIINNLISNNKQIGLKLWSSGESAKIYSIMNNTICKNDDIGIYIDTLTIQVLYNNVYGNKNYNLKLSENMKGCDVNVTKNWWGITNITIIEDKIYDFNEDFRLGKVIYQPILSNSINFKIEEKKKPAIFEVSHLVIEPEEIFPGDIVNVSVLVTNVGEETGTCKITLNIEGGDPITLNVTLGGGGFKRVSFEVSPLIDPGFLPWTYDVEIEGLTGSFKVKEPKTPARFEVYDLQVHPLEIVVEEEDDVWTFRISVNVTNTGDLEGNHTVELKIDGSVIDLRTLTLAGGEATIVLFEVQRGIGTYQVEVEGLKDSFTVTLIHNPTFWDKIPGFTYESIILGLVFGVFIIVFLYRARNSLMTK